ncbi:hypothetical protein TNCV_3520961 [Trichonephila clavipes]|nr:hypothetical protein TNCV_3520961 [Trichonephila clavipes]
MVGELQGVLKLGKHKKKNAVGKERSVISRMCNRLQEVGNIRCLSRQNCPLATTAIDDLYLELTVHRDKKDNTIQLQRQLLSATG